MTGPIAEPHRRQPLPQRRASEMFELCHGGKRATFHVTLGRYPDGRVGEVFITGSKSGSDLEANVRDTAILVSLALQHGVPLATMAAAITREGDGSASTVIGVVLDKLASEGAQP
jgi:ribonucleoside-diphosphate reductase alpha chain